MKVKLMLAALAVAGLAACGDESATESKPAAPAASAAPAAPAPAAPAAQEEKKGDDQPAAAEEKKVEK